MWQHKAKSSNVPDDQKGISLPEGACIGEYLDQVDRTEVVAMVGARRPAGYIECRLG